MNNDIESYFNDQLVNRIESDFYDEKSYQMVDEYNENKKQHWYFWEDEVTMRKCIIAAKTRLKEMIQSGSDCENDNSIESAVKEGWEDNLNDIQDDYPNWDDYYGSSDYYKEAGFISEIWWEDFNKNYEGELRNFKSWNSWRDLENQINKLIDDIDEIPGQILQARIETQREVLSEVLDD